MQGKTYTLVSLHNVCLCNIFEIKIVPKTILLLYVSCVNSLSNALPQNSKAIEEFYFCNY